LDWLGIIIRRIRMKDFIIAGLNGRLPASIFAGITFLIS
jgi:hypothetical protein